MRTSSPLQGKVFDYVMPYLKHHHNLQNFMLAVLCINSLRFSAFYTCEKQGFGTLKKLCPAKQVGILLRRTIAVSFGQWTTRADECRQTNFTPIDRASYKWKRAYKRRTAIERVNSRLDVSFGFEVHTIRGQGKMQMRCGLALCVMLAMSLGRI